MKPRTRFPSDSELKSTVTIRNAFFKIVKDIPAALLLSQLYYWSQRTKNPEKWIYKTQKELQEEIFLTPYQQRRAREILVRLGLIEEKCDELPKRMYFRIIQVIDDESDQAFQEENKVKDQSQSCSSSNSDETIINNQETSLLKIKKLDRDSEETSLIKTKKLDHDSEETLSNTNIDKITTKTTSKITTSTLDVARDDTSLAFNTKSHEQFIFNHWKNVMSQPNAKMDKHRKKLIQEALKLGYSTEDLCKAISGCSVTPHNMGKNDRDQRYDGLHIILKNADQIDRFIANFQNPPRQTTRLVKDNINVAERWLAATE